MEPNKPRPFEERRRSSRFAREDDTEFASVWLSPTEEMVLPVSDESLGGIALLLSDPSAFPVGREVGIAYAESFFQATVKHVHARDDGSFVVGFEMRMHA